MRNLLKFSLHNFIRYFWDTYSQEPFVDNWHIEKICEELEKIARRVGKRLPKENDVVINVPPGTTKTAMVSIFFPVWCWVNWYWMKFITTSHSKDLSLESAEYSRDIIWSEKFKAMFPEITIKQDKSKKSNFRVVFLEYIPSQPAPRVKIGGGRVSTSVGSKIIGFHAHIIIPDDIIDPKGTTSIVAIKEANDYIDHTISTRSVNKRVTTMIMIMQRLHQNDPTAHMLKKIKEGKNIKHICLPGQLRDSKDKARVRPLEFLSYYENGLLDANRLDESSLKSLKIDLGTYGFEGQIEQDPVPAKGGMFHVDKILVIDQFPSPNQILEDVRYWDKAATDGGGCFTAGTRMIKRKDGKILIADVRRGQWDSGNRERIIRKTAEADGIDTKVYHEQEPGSSGKDSALATNRNLEGFFAEGDRPTGSKVTRADLFSVPVNDGDVLMMRGDWNEPFIDELRHFPFSTFKDQVDSASGAYRTLCTLKKVKVG
jgi:predicted phage terminase large subunit-like protein